MHFLRLNVCCYIRALTNACKRAHAACFNSFCRLVLLCARLVHVYVHVLVDLQVPPFPENKPGRWVTARRRRHVIMEGNEVYVSAS